MPSGKKVFSLALALGLATTAGFAVAAQIALEPVEAGAGLVSTPACLVAAKVDFSYSIGSGGSTNVTGVTITGVSSDCSGDYISLKVLNSSGETIDEIIWHPFINSGDTTITLRANGSSTQSSNSSSNGVTTSWPDSQTSPEGIQYFASSQVNELRFSILGASRAATN